VNGLENSEENLIEFIKDNNFFIDNIKKLKNIFSIKNYKNSLKKVYENG